MELNKLICEKYLAGETLTSLAKEFKKGKRTIRKLLVHNNIEIKKKGFQTKYTCNHNYFEVLNNNSAYFLGFMFADGYITDNNRVCINLSSKDVSVLESFKKELNYTGPIGTHKGFHKQIQKDFEFKSLRITSEKLCKDLAKYGVTPRKTKTIQFPNLPDHLVSDFIRGYFDGDGWLSKGQKTILGFCSGSKQFLTSLESILRDKLDLKVKKLYVKNENCFVLHYGAKQDIADIQNFLYDDSSLYLKRKYIHLQPKVSLP